VSRSQRWSDLRSPELGERLADPGTVVLVPLGAIEQHGAHLPVDVDVHLAGAVCDAVAERAPDVLVAPAVPWGFSTSHEPFSGTISLQPDTLVAVLRDVLRCIVDNGCRTTIVVNGHNGNVGPAAQVVAEMGADGDAFVGLVNYFDLTLETFREQRVTAIGGEGHAGELETSLELHLRPERVGDERDVRYVEPVARRGFADLTQRGALIQGFNLARDYPEGVMGDPRPATSGLGEALFQAAVEGLAEIAGDLSGRALQTAGTTTQREDGR
jgi:creatinine amidohydrolase